MLTRWFETSQENLETLLSTLVIPIWWKKTFTYITILIIAGFLIFVGYLSISDEFRFWGCGISIWYLFIRKPQWRTTWKSLQPGMGNSFKCILGRFNLAFNNIVTDKCLTVSRYCKHYSRWMTYLDMMKQQHCLHVNIQENSSEAPMNGWEYFLPFYFVTNKLNYARYGSYYLDQMKNRGYLSWFEGSCISARAKSV